MWRDKTCRDTRPFLRFALCLTRKRVKRKREQREGEGKATAVKALLQSPKARQWDLNESQRECTMINLKSCSQAWSQRGEISQSHQGMYTYVYYTWAWTRRIRQFIKLEMKNGRGTQIAFFKWLAQITCLMQAFDRFLERHSHWGWEITASIEIMLAGETLPVERGGCREYVEPGGEIARFKNSWISSTLSLDRKVPWRMYPLGNRILTTHRKNFCKARGRPQPCSQGKKSWNNKSLAHRNSDKRCARVCLPYLATFAF